MSESVSINKATDQLQSELVCVAVFICVSIVCVDIVSEMTMFYVFILPANSFIWFM